MTALQRGFNLFTTTNTDKLLTNQLGLRVYIHCRHLYNYSAKKADTYFTVRKGEKAESTTAAKQGSPNHLYT